MLLSSSAVAFLVLGLCAAEKSPDSELINEVMKNTAVCAAKLNIKYDVCMEMFNENTDKTLDKYGSCKCMIPCVAKKMKAMNEDGTFNEEEIKKYIANLKTPGYKEEAERVYPMCKDVEGKDCEGGYNMMNCVMMKSEKAKAVTMKMINMLSGKA